MLKEIYNRIYTFGWVRIKQKIIENNIKPVRVYTFGWVRIKQKIIENNIKPVRVYTFGWVRIYSY